MIEIVRQYVNTFDSIVYNFLSKIASPNLTIIMKLFSYLASSWVLIIISAIAYFFLKFYKKKTLYANIIIINMVVSTFLDGLFKVMFHRGRPDILRLVTANGYSFPSGHSMIGLAFYGLLLYLLFRSVSSKVKKFWITFGFVGLIIAIGVSRIYLGVHYASDVLAGFSFGIAWLTVVIAFLKRYEAKRALENDILS